MKICRYTFVVISCLIMGACASWRDAGQLPVLPLMEPATYAGAVQLQQVLTVENQGKSHRVQAAVLINAETVSLLAMSQMGQRLLEVHYDGDTLQQVEGAIAEKAFKQKLPGRMILAQMQLAYWPLAQLQKTYQKPWRLVEQSCQRQLYHKKRLKLSIDYGCVKPGVGILDIHPLEHNSLRIVQQYSPLSLEIKTVSQKNLAGKDGEK